MKNLDAIALAFLFVCSQCSESAADVHTQGQVEETTLCESLEKVDPGEKLQITASGIYEVGPEMAIFYDPQQPTCELDVQPVTWVEFDNSVRARSGENYLALQRILDRATKASVVFQGELYGPGKVGVDDTSIPTMLSYANRTARLRYGHLNSFRTKFVVHSIVDSEPAPKGRVEGGQWHRKEPPLSDPKITSMSLPIYPRMPKLVGIEGSVVVDVRIKSGKVVRAVVRSGDRMLQGSALETIRTWAFEPEIDRDFTTTFVYKLELRATGRSRTPRIILELPERVTIIGAAHGW